MLLKAGEMLVWCWCLAWLCLNGEYLLRESAPLRKYLPKWALWIQTSSGQSEWLRDSLQRKQAVSYHRESHIDRWGGERSWSLRVSLKGSKGSKGSWIFQNVERRNFAVTITVLPLARLRSFRHQCVGMCTKNKMWSWFSRVHICIYIHIYHITNVCNIQCTYTSIIFYLKVLSMLEKECSSLFLVHSVLHPWCNEFYFKEVSPALLCASFREMPLVTGLVKPVPAKPCSARVEFMALGFYCEFITSQMTSVTVILGSCWKALRMIVGYPANAA